MTSEQFAALSALIGWRSAAAGEAARLVLVDGVAPSVAAGRAGVSRSSACNAVTRAKKAIELAKKITK